jgi:hypothetical protein
MTAIFLCPPIEIYYLCGSSVRGKGVCMHYFYAIKLRNEVAVECRPISLCRMSRDRDTALAMNVVDNLRGRFFPGDILVDSHGDDMKAGRCNLFTDKNCRTSDEAGVPPTSPGCEDTIVVRNGNGMQPLTTSTSNKREW